MAEVRVKSLHKAFPDGTVAVHELELTIADGELFVMLGPSGCGKTTTLRCIAGLEKETSGQIVIGDEVVSGLRPSQRDIAMVFQFYALYPHLSVHDNMAFPLRAAKHSASEISERVNEAARLLRLEPLMKRKPNKLSGGEQQRVALGRAIVRHPKAFLMDEPLTNLDAELRADMRAELKHVQQRLRLDDDLRDPRPDRGDGARPPDRDPEPGPPRAGGRRRWRSTSGRRRCSPRASSARRR